MKKITGIGLCPPEHLGITGRTGEVRVRKLCTMLAGGDATSQRDAKDLRQVLDLLIEGENQAAEQAFGDLDTAVRDTFIQAYTADYTDRRAKSAIAKALKIQFNRKEYRRTP